MCIYACMYAYLLYMNWIYIKLLNSHQMDSQFKMVALQDLELTSCHNRSTVTYKPFPLKKT